MTTENVEAPAVEEQDDAAFASAFNEAAGIEAPPVVEAEAPKAEESVVETTPEPVTESSPKDEEPGTVLSTDEVKALLGRLEEMDAIKKQIRDVNGRFGAVSETLGKLKEARSAGGSVEISDDDLAELSEYGDLKGSMSTVLKRVLAKAGGSTAPAQFDTAPVEQKFQQQLEERDRKYEARLLTAYHSDWRDVVASDDYRLHLQGLPEETRTQIENSWNAEEIAQSIRDFKAAKATKQTTTQNRTRRLEAAVTPTGNASAAPAVDEQDAFAAGFRSVRG